MTDTTKLVVNGLDNLLTKLSALCDAASDALVAYARMATLELKVEELPEMQALRKELRLLTLRESVEVKRKAQRDRAARHHNAPKAATPAVAVKPALQGGTKAVEAKEAAKAKREAPLTQPLAPALKEALQPKAEVKAEQKELTEAELELLTRPGTPTAAPSAPAS